MTPNCYFQSWFLTRVDLLRVTKRSSDLVKALELDSLDLNLSLNDKLYNPGVIFNFSSFKNWE